MIERFVDAGGDRSQAEEDAGEYIRQVKRLTGTIRAGDPVLRFIDAYSPEENGMSQC